jgi:hypothetical protein
MSLPLAKNYQRCLDFDGQTSELERAGVFVLPKKLQQLFVAGFGGTACAFAGVTGVFLPSIRTVPALPRLGPASVTGTSINWSPSLKPLARAHTRSFDYVLVAAPMCDQLDVAVVEDLSFGHHSTVQKR